MQGCSQDTQGVQTGDACAQTDHDLSDAAVCGESDSMTGFCHEDETFYEAANICMSVGARLCSLEEIMVRLYTFE